MDWTAAAFGTLVTVLGALFTGLLVFARRELDGHRERVTRLEARLEAVEDDHVFLQPLAEHLRRKVQKEATRMRG